MHIFAAFVTVATAARTGKAPAAPVSPLHHTSNVLVGVCGAKESADMVTAEKRLHFLGKLFLRLVGLCYTVHGMSLHWMFFLVVKLYQMDVAHAILFAKTIDISRVTADYSSAKFE